MSFALPWNRSADAILGFMEQSNYCHSDLGGSEKQARTLTRFTDYILEENANRWRGKQAFVSTGEMKEAWSSFYSTLLSQGANKKTQFQPHRCLWAVAHAVPCQQPQLCGRAGCAR